MLLKRVLLCDRHQKSLTECLSEGVRGARTYYKENRKYIIYSDMDYIEYDKSEEDFGTRRTCSSKNNSSVPQLPG